MTRQTGSVFVIDPGLFVNKWERFLVCQGAAKIVLNFLEITTETVKLSFYILQFFNLNVYVLAHWIKL